MNPNDWTDEDWEEEQQELNASFSYALTALETAELGLRSLQGELTDLGERLAELEKNASLPNRQLKRARPIHITNEVSEEELIRAFDPVTQEEILRDLDYLTENEKTSLTKFSVDVGPEDILGGKTWARVNVSAYRAELDSVVGGLETGHRGAGILRRVEVPAFRGLCGREKDLRVLTREL